MMPKPFLQLGEQSEPHVQYKINVFYTVKNYYFISKP
jgi:hypothetical protein